MVGRAVISMSISSFRLFLFCLILQPIATFAAILVFFVSINFAISRYSSRSPSERVVDLLDTYLVVSKNIKLLFGPEEILGRPQGFKYFHLLSCIDRIVNVGVKV